MKNELTIIDERELLGKEFRIYGTFENPLFLAKDVANWIEHSNPSKMLSSIDEEEKTTLTISYNGNMTTNQLFLTEARMNIPSLFILFILWSSPRW